MVLRGLAAGAAVTAVVGAVVMSRWDTAAGKRVADLTRARASDDWRHEERVAELETDLEESRELRTKLEHKLRAKRTELQGLRNEHAALLLRYAQAQTERASALEGRRLLAIETSASTHALSAAASGDLVPVKPNGTVQAAAEATKPAAPGATVPTARAAASVLYAKANAALDRLAKAGAARATEGEPSAERPAEDGPESASDSPTADGSAQDGSATDASVRDGSATDGSVRDGSATDASVQSKSPKDGSAKGDSAKGAPAKGGAPKGGPTGGGSWQGASRSAPATGEAVPEGAAQGKPEAVGGHERAAATTTPTPMPAPMQSGEAARPSAPPTAQESAPAPATAPAPAIAASPDGAAALKPAPKPLPLSGFFTVPRAVAVVPTSSVRRPSVEGGFDFFGTQKRADALESVQNEDLADVVGQEALALHKGASESEFKPADEVSRGVGQVIYLTAHDETEQIDVAELRGAVS